MKVENGVLSEVLKSDLDLLENDPEKFWSGVTKIGAGAFKNCTKLTKITLPEGITEIGNSAFKGCTSLTNINLPVRITEIKEGAFFDCINLTKITLPDSVTKIEARAFVNCSSLTDITLPEGFTMLGEAAFHSCINLTKINLPDSVTEIEADAFSGCTSLTDITLPDGITELEDNVFDHCTSLTNISLPNSVQEIGIETFFGCTSLTNLTVPASVTKIWLNAFMGLSDNVQLKFETGENIVSVDKDAFKDTNLRFIYVTKDGKNVILSGKEDKELEKTSYKFDYKIEDAIKFLTPNYRENFVTLKAWRESGKIKFMPPEFTLKTFPSSQIANYFVNANNQRWGRLVKTLRFDTLEDNEKINSLTDLMKLYYAIGGFSENQGESENAEQYILKYVVPKIDQSYKPLNAANDIHKRFNKLSLSGAYCPEFAQFFMKYYKDNPDFMKIDLKDESEDLMDPDDYLCSAHNNFKRILKDFPNRVVNTNETNALLSPVFVAEHCINIEYEGVEAGNELLAEKIRRYGYTQDQFDEIQKVYNKAKKVKDVFYISADKAKSNDCITYRVLKKQDENILDSNGDPLPDPLGFLLGDITNCCMKWNNERSLGASCVDDGYTNQHAGFLVFEENLSGSGENGKTSRILGQAYIWYDPQTKTVCYDNIEIPSKIIREMKKKNSSVNVGAFLNAVADSAKAIMEGMNQEGTPVERVTLGTGYLDDVVDNKKLYDYYKARFGEPESQSIAEHRGYSGYSDAKTAQFVIATYDKKTKKLANQIAETLNSAEMDLNEATVAENQIRR